MNLNSGTFVLVISLSASTLYGQLSRQDAQSISNATQNAVRATYEWGKSKKLSLYDKDRPEPRPQRDCLSPRELDDNSIGYLDYWESKVLQIVSPTDSLLMLGNLSNPPVMLTEYPTKGLVDGDKVRIVGLIEVTGTKPYSTGSQTTLRTIRLVTNERKAELVAHSAAKKKAEDVAAEAARIRIWTDDTGSHKFEGTFLTFKNNKARLERKDGKIIEVPMSRLSKKDQQWIRDDLREK